LGRLARPLAEAGLQRVNVSLDTLDPEKFRRLTRWGDLQDVWDGIQAAEEAGLAPIKINAVVVQGYNESDVVELAQMTLDHPWQVRFIEMMPFAGATDLQLNQVVRAEEMQARIESVFGVLETVNSGKLDGEARLFHIPGALGDVGFISSVTQPFCAECNRARLTADGRLRLCLLREGEVDLLSPLRSGANLEELRQIVLDGIWAKPWGHGLADGVIPLNRVMSEIGG
jgi:cyclic pyranopterin phosphate synthase